MEHSYYLHTNGNIIYKKNQDICDYRDSDFVRMFWRFDPSNRENAWQILVEAGSIDAKKSRILELAEKWGCDDNDAQVYAKRINITLKKDGNKWCAHKKDFINLQDYPTGFGDTCLEALINLCEQLEFSPTKLNWHKTFKELCVCTREEE